MLRLDGEASIEPGQEVLQHGRGLVDGPGASQTQFGDQPVLEGSCRSFDPALGLG